MRRLLLAIAAVAGVFLQTGVAVAAPVLHLSGWKASAGKPETFTITRVGGNGAATVVFRTSDGSAVAPTDYTATSVTLSWQPRQTTATVQVPTFVNLAHAGQNISFTASITANGAKSSATGLIVEPPAPVPAPAPTPTPTPIGPITAWVPAPLTVGGYACNKAQANTPNIGPCGSSIVYRITASMMSSDAVPVPMFTAVFFQDSSGNFPVGDAYATSFVGYWAASDLIGIAPAP